MTQTLYRWDTTLNQRVEVTAEDCRDAIAQLETQLDELAFLPDSIRVGRRATGMGSQRTGILQRLSVWQSRLYTLTGGAEGKRPGCQTVHV